jgi:hypothetical protein
MFHLSIKIRILHLTDYQSLKIIGIALEDNMLFKIRWTHRSREPNTPIATQSRLLFFLSAENKQIFVNKLKRFFWLCSGSNLKILDSALTEGAKYAGIGATIFFTGIFASIAATYAIFTFTDNIWLSSLFGLVWGGMIFNLDRYIVSSMRKSNSWKKEWTMALPRIVLAIIISLVIARPLELKIFEKEIATELLLMNDEIAQARIDSTNSYYKKLISTNQKDIDQLLEAVASLQRQRDELRAIASAEADGTGGSMKRNPGPIYKIKKANADKVDDELTALKFTNQQHISSKRAQQDKWQLENNEKLKLLEKPD